MANQGRIYLLHVLGSRTWLNFGINPYYFFALHCSCPVFRWAPVLFVCLTCCVPSSFPPLPPPSVSHTCHCGAALIGASQSPAHLLPAGSHWPQSETPRFFPPPQEQTHSSENDLGLGCVVIISRATTIWVHMVALVWSAICCQAVAFFIWIISASEPDALWCWIPPHCWDADALLPLESEKVAQPSQDFSNLAWFKYESVSRNNEPFPTFRESTVFPTPPPLKLSIRIHSAEFALLLLLLHSAPQLFIWPSGHPRSL